ncbi:MAG: hypothetical protein FD123_998 [Bacteroidetes bacterium]|nr:MAG: hypothetical protein FD123_998 [Bacteroidota bacterium]
MRALLLLFLLFLLLITRLHAQDDPNYISANVPMAYYNPAAVPFSKRGEMAAVFRNQSGTELFNGQAGIFSTNWKGKKGWLAGGLLYEADKGLFQSVQRLNLSCSPRVCRIKESEIRLGLRFGLSWHHFDSNKFLDAMQDTLYMHDAVPDIRRGTFCLHSGILWQNRSSSISFACKITPGIQHIRSNQGDMSSLYFSSSPNNIQLYGHIKHTFPIASAGLLRINLMGHNAKYQQILFLYLQNKVTDPSAAHYYFRQYRNGDSKIFLTANLDYMFDKYSIGITARGFSPSINTAGLTVGLNWPDNGRFWVAALAPNKKTGFVCETGLSYSIQLLTQKAPLPPP